MITAEEALTLALNKKRTEIEPHELNDEEVIAAGYLDYCIDNGIYDRFNGEPFEIIVPAEIAKSVHVIQAVKKRFEQGRWTVAVFPRVEGDEVKTFQLVFCPKEIVTALPAVQALPMVVESKATAQALIGPRILVRMPTRGRPYKALEALSKYRSMAGMPIQIEVVLDVDDETANSEFLYRLNALDCTITFGQHKSKIEACNGGRLKEWDVLVLASDDMVPVKDGWAKRVAELYEEHWPNFDGCLHLDDGYAHERVCTLSIMGRRYYDEIGYVYHPDYKSLFCDDEHTEVARRKKRITYVPEVFIEHQHPVAGKGKLDGLYVRNDALWKVDKATFEERKSHDFYLAQPKLSVLILTCPERRRMLTRLLEELYWQKSRTPWLVEILVDHKTPGSLGERRQVLLERARGEYVCFVDDDDWIAHDYLTRICQALEGHDCTSLVGVLTTNGSKMERFEHSLKHEKWATLENGRHIRTPNHLNAVRRDLALQAGFKNLNFSEDHEFSKAVKPLLKTEADTGEQPLYLYWYRTKSHKHGATT